MKLSKHQIISSILILVILQIGCAPALLVGGAAVGVGATAYVRGELVATEKVSMNQAWNASLEACNSLGFAVTDKEKDSLSGKIVARGAEDKKIQIRVKKEATNITELRIRVGFFGDEEMSRQILDEIQSNY